MILYLHIQLLLVINGLNDQVRNIQEESELKSQAFGDLKTKNRQTSHEMYRKLIQLNGAQGTLPQEPTSSVSHLAKIIEYFQASEKFAEYAATLSEIYNDRFGDKGEQCSSDGTCKSEILPTKLPMLRVNYDTMTYVETILLIHESVSS